MNLSQTIFRAAGLISRSAASISTLTTPQDWLIGSFTLPGADSGVAVNSKTIQQIPAYVSGLRLISETIGTLSGKIIQKEDSKITYLTDHPAFYLAFRKPNRFQTAPVFWETVTKYAVHKGNAFAAIVRDANFKPEELLFIHESKTVEVIEYEDKLYYRVQGISEIIPSENILHFKGLGDGRIGIGAIEYAATTAGVSLATQKNQAKFYKSGSKLQGVIEHPKTLSEKAQKTLRDSWHNTYHSDGPNNTTAILDEGMTYKSISVAPEAAKYLETLKNGSYDIAAILRVPPHMIAQMDKSSFNNIEQQSLELVKYSLHPWVNRFEYELWDKLLTEAEKKSNVVSFKFNMETLLRGDYKTRMEGYGTAISHGIMSPNDARKLENLEPQEGGNDLYIPMNWMPLSKVDDILNRAGDQLALQALKAKDNGKAD